MPEMDGVEATKKIRNGRPHIRVIILTTYETDEYIFGGIGAGARANLLKDSSPAGVLGAIRTVYRGESPIQPRVATRLLDRVSQLAQDPPPAPVLSDREAEVLRLISADAANKEAAELFIGGSTVKTHVIRIFNKLGAGQKQ